MSVLGFLRRKLRPRSEVEAGRALYFALLAQARLPAFYGSLGVPDTIDGRFDMVALHAALAFRRLRSLGGRDADVLSDATFDIMTADLERSIRELGVGDAGVARRVKTMARAFYGRAQAYERALAGTESLEDALRRNVFGTVVADDATVARLTDYVRRAAAGADRQSLDDLKAGHAGFPPTPYGA
ncbi:MAG: ubiquinol-cytochrome C chaperone [Alphaproteobacteria bacterium]|nr:ubiquinol-cytochrome C chaperone [Alphaproteobacteria bacterium]